MNTVLYKTVREVYDCGSEKRVSYGIIACADSVNDAHSQIVAAAHDVSADKKRMDDLVCLCNRCGLSPDHLYDVIEDFLAL